MFAAGTFTRYLIEVVFFPSLKLSFPTHLNCFFNPIEVVFSPSFKLCVPPPPFKRCFPRDLSGGFPRFKGCFPPNLSGIFAVVAASQGQERNRVRWGSGTHPKPAPPARARPLRGMRRTRVSSPPSLVSRFWGRGEKLKEFGGPEDIGGENKTPSWESQLFSIPALQSGGADPGLSPGPLPALAPTRGSVLRSERNSPAMPRASRSFG